MTIEEKIALIEEIMDLDEKTLKEDDNLSEYEEWDSLSKLSLMAEAKKMGKTLTVEQIRTFNKVKDICDFLDD